MTRWLRRTVGIGLGLLAVVGVIIAGRQVFAKLGASPRPAFTVSVAATLPAPSPPSPVRVTQTSISLTPTPSPTSTPTPVPPGGIILQDDFSQENPFWRPGGPSYDGGQALHEGGYRVWAEPGPASYWVTLEQPPPLEDFVLEATARAQPGSRDFAYGLIFRRRPASATGYVFLVSDRGAFSISLQTPDDWVRLRDWTATDAIQPGAPNRLKVIASGPRIAVFVNDQFLAGLEDDRITAGYVGFYVVNFATDSPAAVLFDDLVVRRPSLADLAAFTITPVAPPAPVVSRPSQILHPIPTALPISPEALQVAHGATVHLLLQGTDGNGRSGTGAVVGADGRTLLTAYHVVGDPNTGELYEGEIRVGPFMDWVLTAEVVGAAPQYDLAVLRVNPAPGFQGFAIVPMGDSDALRIGSTVYTLSYPSVGQGSLITTQGVVLGVFQGEDGSPNRYILTDARADPGSSGGVAVNERGELIGIVTALVVRTDVLERLGYPELTQATVLTPINLARPLVEAAMQP